MLASPERVNKLNKLIVQVKQGKFTEAIPLWCTISVKDVQTKKIRFANTKTKTEIVHSANPTWTTSASFILSEDTRPKIHIKCFTNQALLPNYNKMGRIVLDPPKETGKPIERWYTLDRSKTVAEIYVYACWEELGSKLAEGRHLAIAYDDICDKLDTGDIILCHGTERISRGIEVATLSFWSHVAMIVRGPSENVKALYKTEECFQRWAKDIEEIKELTKRIEQDQYEQQSPKPGTPKFGSPKPGTPKSNSLRKLLRIDSKKNLNYFLNVKWPDTLDKNLTLEQLKQLANSKITDDDIYLFESDMSTFDRRQGGGVQLVPFKWWLLDNEKYYGRRMYTVVRRLHLPHGKPRPNLDAWLERMHSKPYETKRVEFVLSVIKQNKKDCLDMVFCSELIAATYKHMQLIHTKHISSNFLPRDFAQATYRSRLHFRHRTKDLHLEGGAYLEDELRIFLNKLIRKKGFDVEVEEERKVDLESTDERIEEEDRKTEKMWLRSSENNKMIQLFRDEFQDAGDRMEEEDGVIR